MTWTSPIDAASGLLRQDGQYHCAQMQVIEHHGRLWRTMERRDPPQAWGTSFRAGIMSIPIEADLLNAANWTWSEFLPSDSAMPTPRSTGSNIPTGSSTAMT